MATWEEITITTTTTMEITTTTIKTTTKTISFTPAAMACPALRRFAPAKLRMTDTKPKRTSTAMATVLWSMARAGRCDSPMPCPTPWAATMALFVWKPLPEPRVRATSFRRPLPRWIRPPTSCIIWDAPKFTMRTRRVTPFPWTMTFGTMIMDKVEITLMKTRRTTSPQSITRWICSSTVILVPNTFTPTSVRIPTEDSIRISTGCTEVLDWWSTMKRIVPVSSSPVRRCFS
mmetsp:Transcript_29546/g.81217  ORF Transcript_29546/g.81217 Transcript_29546/m.81217 type:complete len:232 (+) Transcript_29546:633-1328(+)